jgi:hypothetical protein
VKIANDPVFGTPVFTTLSGKSQCPAETSTLAREANVSIESITPLCGGNRDAPCALLECDKPAHFRVRIQNKSPTGQDALSPLPPLPSPVTLLSVVCRGPPFLFNLPCTSVPKDNQPQKVC